MILEQPETVFDLPEGFIGLNPKKVFFRPDDRLRRSPSQLSISARTLYDAAEYVIVQQREQGRMPIDVSTMEDVIVAAVDNDFVLTYLASGRRIARKELIACASQSETGSFRCVFVMRNRDRLLRGLGIQPRLAAE